MSKAIWVAASAAGVLAVASVANAQEAPRSIFTRPVNAPSSALEIGVGGGYQQGVGDISSAGGQRIQDSAGPGGSVEVDVGYRASPAFFIGAYGQGGWYQRNTSNAQFTNGNARDLTAGIQAQWHFAPYSGMDPYVGLGTGYHGLWLAQTGPNSNYAGWEIARGRLGADFRISNEVAIGPEIGASANMFFQEKLPGDTSFHDISGKRVNVFFFGGVTGHFDMAGTSVRPASNVAAR